MFAEASRLWWLAAVVLYVGLWLWRRAGERKRLAMFGEETLVDGLIDPAIARRKWRFILGAAAATALILAAARPQFGTKLTEVKRRGSDVFIAIDVSKSMLAEDVPPSRMAKAKRALGLLIRSMRGDRVGIIAFGGRAFLHCPLTLDVDAAGMFLDSVTTGTVASPGTSLGSPIRRAMDHFPEDSGARKIIVLLTDGEDTRDSSPLEAAREAEKAGIKIYTLGLGTPRGDVIKLRDEKGEITGFKKDDAGETVLSRLDEATLLEMARITGGRYFRSSPDDGEILTLVDEISSFASHALSTRMHRVREDRYQIPCLIALLFLMAELLVPLREGHYRAMRDELRSVRFRLPSMIRGGRSGGAMAVLLAVSLATMPGVAGADFKTHLKRGNSHYTSGRMDEARQEYFNAQAEAPEAAEAPYNIGNTYYHEGDYEEAVKFYDQADALARNPAIKAVIAYNRGCALFRAGRETEAIEAFKQALRINPADEDAKYNLEWIKSPKSPRQHKEKGEKQEDKSGELSKEDAERLLEMVRDKERNSRQDQKDEDEESATGVKDW